MATGGPCKHGKAFGLVELIPQYFTKFGEVAQIETILRHRALEGTLITATTTICLYCLILSFPFLYIFNTTVFQIHYLATNV